MISDRSQVEIGVFRLNKSKNLVILFGNHSHILDSLYISNAILNEKSRNLVAFIFQYILRNSA